MADIFPEPAWGRRPDGTAKGTGWMGMMPMTDGSGRVMSEYSATVDYNGKPVLIPTITPNIQQGQLDWLRAGKGLTDEIVRNAMEFAKPRLRMGLSPFKGEYLPDNPYTEPFAPRR